MGVADDGGRVVVIKPGEVVITTESHASFLTADGTDALPVPDLNPGNVFPEFQNLLSLSDENFHRFIAFLLVCLMTNGPYLILLLEGEQGSGKSFLNWIIKVLIDPSHAPKLRMPDNERDLMVLAKNIYLLLFDNVLGIFQRIFISDI